MPWRQRLLLYLALIRFDRPIGTLLLLWPTLWALWIAAGGVPDTDVLAIFVMGTFLMRSAGCVINDYADIEFDRHVKRTAQRPLTTGQITRREALGLFAGLCIAAFALVLLTNTQTVLLSFAGLALASIYPYTKRHTHFPQLVLGAAFSWGVPMAFSAQTQQLPSIAWLIYAAALCWAVIYDTFYAMVDRDDDVIVGIKSTAVWLGQHDRLATGLLQCCMLVLLTLVGWLSQRGVIYFGALTLAAGLFCYQQYLIRHRERSACFRAFLNNNWVGLAIFIGLALDYGLDPHIVFVYE